MGAALFLVFRPGLEPDRVTVQHVLIAFAGTNTKATRSKAEAEKLAVEIRERADRGEPFDELVKRYSDDEAHPGIYTLCNKGVKPGPDEYDRAMMVPAFGDLAFTLKVGKIRMTAYDAKASPFGWHIMKRLR